MGLFLLRSGYHQASSPPITIPVNADVLVVFGCEVNHTSFRKKTTGSIFIQTLCRVLGQHWRRHSIMTMLTMVNSEIADQVMPSRRHGGIVRFKQTGNFQSSLRKQFFFSSQVSGLLFQDGYFTPQ